MVGCHVETCLLGLGLKGDFTGCKTDHQLNAAVNKLGHCDVSVGTGSIPATDSLCACLMDRWAHTGTNHAQTTPISVPFVLCLLCCAFCESSEGAVLPAATAVCPHAAAYEFEPSLLLQQVALRHCSQHCNIMSSA